MPRGGTKEIIVQQVDRDRSLSFLHSYRSIIISSVINHLWLTPRVKRKRNHVTRSVRIILKLSFQLSIIEI